MRKARPFQSGRKGTVPASTRHAARRHLGFTLLELLMVITIMAALLALAAPSFVSVIRNNRLTAQVNQLVYSLTLARSEAVKRGAPVSMCKSSNGTACQTTGVNWENGWMVFSDLDRDGVYDAADGEELLQITQPLTEGYTLRGSTELVDRVTFDPLGVSRVQGTFMLCAGNRTDYARASGVNLAGRIRRGDDNDRDGIPERLDGSEITSCVAP